tara:strand:+ start:1175 stop:1795 length:621 start_codon:yes stop_codon:yes gene_type:complete
MKNRSLQIIILLITFNSYCQKGHLTPSNNFENNIGILKEYYDNVFPLLYNNFEKKPFARYTAMPSFGTEYAFSIELKDNEFIIISNTLTQNYWYAKNKENVKLISKKKAIDKTLYKKIGELFNLLSIQTKPIEEELYKTDGTTYYFATTNSNGEIKIGETWSSENKSNLGKLTEICDVLFEIGNGKENQGTEIEKEIDKLIEQLNK